MKKIKRILLTATLSIGMLAGPIGANAASYTVKDGDTLWNISNKFGISLLNLKNANDHVGSLLYPGQRLTVPTTVSSEDQDLMAKLVSAEAKGEPYAGKVAVATVILNRVDSPDFPNTVKGVIYERAGGYYAFTPVQNGTINQAPDAESVRAVKEAIGFRGQGQGSLYFYNPKTAVSDWVFSRKTTITIGNHRFAK